MKKVIFYFFLLLGSVCAFTACDNDDDDDNVSGVNNILMFGNETFQYVEAFYDYEYGSGDDFASMELIFILVPERVDVATIDLDDDIDNMVELNFMILYKDGNTTLPIAGTYPYEKDAEKDMTICRGHLTKYLNGDYIYSDFGSGNCKIAKNGTIYTIEFDFVCEEGQIIKGTYKGTLKDYDE